MVEHKPHLVVDLEEEFLGGVWFKTLRDLLGALVEEEALEVMVDDDWIPQILRNEGSDLLHKGPAEQKENRMFAREIGEALKHSFGLFEFFQCIENVGQLIDVLNGIEMGVVDGVAWSRLFFILSFFGGVGRRMRSLSFYNQSIHLPLSERYHHTINKMMIIGERGWLNTREKITEASKKHSIWKDRVVVIVNNYAHSFGNKIGIFKDDSFPLLELEMQLVEFHLHCIFSHYFSFVPLGEDGSRCKDGVMDNYAIIQSGSIGRAWSSTMGKET
ncbi:hypothetical protein Tco_1421504 [Tanacetum coccineum]